MKKSKWIFIVPILLFAMSVAILSFHKPVWAETSVDVSTFFQGEGTEEAPYLISKIADLNKLSNDVAGGTQYLNTVFELTNDIDFEGKSFLAIGNSGNPFKGVFDGAGYSISDVVIDSTSSLTLGLFGAADGATIKNLGIKNIQISSVDVATEQTQILVGGICGSATNTTISQCFVKNDDDKKIVVSATKNANVGGICGKLANGSRIENCFSNVKIETYSNSTFEIDCFVGGIAGNVIEGQILNSYSAGDVTCGNLVAENQETKIFAGGACGFVQGSCSTIKNCFALGNVFATYLRATDKIVLGAMIGGVTSNESMTPAAGNINYCHFLQTESVNKDLLAIASGTYHVSSVVIKAHKDVAFFQRATSFDEAESFDTWNGFDFDEVWLIDAGFPELQLFAFYNIQIEQADNLTLNIEGGEIVDDQTRKFKAGAKVVINATINPEVEKFYHVQTWRKDQAEIASTERLMSYEFDCSYSTQGIYSVVLKENNFNLTIKISASSFGESSGAINVSNIASIRFDSTLVGNGLTDRSIPYGREVSVEAVLGTSEDAQNYAFAGWFAGSDATTQLDWASPVLNFKIGDNTVPFDDDRNIVLTPKFTRDICRLTVEFDANMGKVRLYETEEFSGDAVANKPIKKGQSLNLEAECLEGYEFVGWFKKGDLDPISSDLKLTEYEIKDDTQNLFAKFQMIGDEEEAKKGLSGWAIFGIVAGCLAVVGAVVLTVVLVKKKGSYKSNWNF